MRRRSSIQVGLVIIGVMVFPMLALAGGWAVVTLDSLPVELRAGQTLSLGFMVRQHGVTPIDAAFGTEPLIPNLFASNTDSGESFHVDGRKQGPLGHFVVDVTFPSAGTWTWEIAPGPFAPTPLGQVTVLPAVATSTQPATAAQPVVAPSPVQPILRWAGLMLILAAAVLALASRRGMSAPRRTSAT